MNASFDTNIVLRMLLNDVPEQTKRVTLLLKRHGYQFTIADQVFVEIEYVLRTYYSFNKEDICNALRVILGLENISANKRLFYEILPLFQSSNSISFVDCLLCGYASLNNALPLYTFDEKLAKISESAELLK